MGKNHLRNKPPTWFSHTFPIIFPWLSHDFPHFCNQMCIKKKSKTSGDLLQRPTLPQLHSPVVKRGRSSAVLGRIQAGRMLAEDRPVREPLGAASISWRFVRGCHQPLEAADGRVLRWKIYGIVGNLWII